MLVQLLNKTVHQDNSKENIAYSGTQEASSNIIATTKTEVSKPGENTQPCTDIQGQHQDGNHEDNIVKNFQEEPGENTHSCTDKSKKTQSWEHRRGDNQKKNTDMGTQARRQSKNTVMGTIKNKNTVMGTQAWRQSKKHSHGDNQKTQSWGQPKNHSHGKSAT